MPATSGKARPIIAYQTPGSNAAQAQERRELELAAQTLLQGTPVQYDVSGATGFIKACPAMVDVATTKIAGFSVEPGSNLTANGTPKTLVLPTAPPNQPAAVIIPGGAPPNDGSIGFVVAVDGNIFLGVLGDGADNTLAVLAQAQLGTVMGLTKDAGNNFWYVDRTKTTAATGAAVEILELVDPIGTLNGRVAFRVLKAVQQLGA
jgi:hypothetical protein